MSDSLENGYKHLANDPEMYTRRRPNHRRPNHHCGFDFSEGLQTAVCDCGAVATNPYYMEQPARTPKELWDEAVAYGKAVENDRIIELLESKLCWCVGQPLDIDKNDRDELMKHMNCDWEAMMIEYHVSLIKRGQK